MLPAYKCMENYNWKIHPERCVGYVWNIKERLNYLEIQGNFPWKTDDSEKMKYEYNRI